jgi:hypothetical protein
MFNLPNNNVWRDDIQGYNTTDPVLGGSAGESNQPLEQLTDRTSYLYDRLGRFEGINYVPAAGTIDWAHAKNRLNMVDVASSVLVALDDISTFPEGARVHLKAKLPQNKTLVIGTTGFQNIVDGNISGTRTYLADGEEVTLVRWGDVWVLTEPRGNHNKVGEEHFLRFQPRNSILANGCTPEAGGALLNRGDFLRLAAVVLPTAIDDATWLSDISNRGFWSTGDGITTMRPPDLRGMFKRGLDLGRGLRLGNLSNTAGNYEADGNKPHQHGLPPLPQTKPDLDRGTGSSTYSIDSSDTGKVTDSSGDGESRPKNIGFYPIIYY